MGALDLHLEFGSAQHGPVKLNVEEYAKGSLLSDGYHNTEKINGSDPDDYEKFEKGIMQYGYVSYLLVALSIWHLLGGLNFLINSMPSTNAFEWQVSTL